MSDNNIRKIEKEMWKRMYINDPNSVYARRGCKIIVEEPIAKRSVNVRV